ncbi:hypothetical protein [Chryseobacterium wanjuense]
MKALIVEGIKDKIWGKSVETVVNYQSVIDEYDREKDENKNRLIGNKFPDNYRQKFAIFGNVEAQKIKDDYVNPKMNIGGKLGFKYFFSPNFNVEINSNIFTLENENIVKRNFFVPEVNLEFILFPKYRFTPYIYGGGGALYSKIKPRYKGQFGGGLEFMLAKNISLRASSQYDVGFKDDWEGLVNGKRKDQALRFALGLNFYIGNK